MSIELPPSGPPERVTLPDSEFERQKLTRQLDVQFSEWGNKAVTRDDPAFYLVPFSEKIISDCMVHDDIEDEVDRLRRPLQSVDEIRILRHRIKRMDALARYAHNEQIDRATIESGAYAEFFNNAFEWILSQGRSDEILAAMTYMRRLYVVREQLTQGTRQPLINVTGFNHTLERIIEDEKKFHHRLST